MAINKEYLFRELNTARYGDDRRHKSLFLPKLLESLARNKQITENENFEKAHAIICKWADLESKGKLKARKESNLDAYAKSLLSGFAERW